MARKTGADCAQCGKPIPSERCPGCGRPVADSAERFYQSLLRTFAGDEVAHGVIVDAFRVMEHPAGGACANHLDAFLAMCREVIGTYGNLS